jgi:hypothetical protein
MKTWPLPRFVSCALSLTITMFVLNMANPRCALCQHLQVQRNNCAVSKSLEPIHFSAGAIDRVSPQESGTLPWNFEATPWRDADQLFRSDPRWLGGDVAYSIDLGRGRVLWVFGDSFIANKPGKTRLRSAFVHNSIAIESGYDQAHASMKFYCPKKNGKHSEFAANEGEVWLWPEDGVRLGEKLLLFFVRVQSDSSKGSLGFKLVGWTAFLVENPDAQTAAWIMRKVDTPQSPTRFIVGSGVLRAGNFLYAFASAEPSHDDYLLRWPLIAAEGGNLSSPEWWCGGSGWVEQSKLTSPPPSTIPEGSNEFSVIWDSHHNKFFIVESMGFGPSDIGIRWADRLEGPWSEPVKVYHPPESGRPDAFVYAGKVHAGLQGGDLVVTYVANSMDDKVLAKDTSIYYPRFVRLNLHQR